MEFLNPILWRDEVRSPANVFSVTNNADGTKTIERAGEEIQEGTPQSAASFGLDENIAYQALLMSEVLAQQTRQHQRSIEALNDEFVGQVVAVTMTNSLVYPFNNSKKTVAINTRDNTNYRVNVEILGAPNNVGEIYITDKAVNGFKIEYTGSAESVSVNCYITGGATLYG